MRTISGGICGCLVALASWHASQADEPATPAAPEVKPTVVDSPGVVPSVTVDWAAEANRLLRETAAALQSRSIEAAEEPAFVALINVAEALKTAERPAPSERARLRALARVRLKQAADVLARQAARAAAAKQAPNQHPAVVREPAGTTLAQQLPGLAGAGQPGFLAGSGGGALSAGNAAELESAQQLMDVITRSIQPESWEDAGGRGVIRYWALGHALVITATSDVHDGVADLVEQLR